MPIIPSAITGFTMAKAFSKGIVGSDMRKVASAVASASTQYIIAASNVISTNVVLGPGSGVSTGKLIGLIPSVMSNLMFVRGVPLGIAGRDAKKLFDSISFGVVMGLQTAISQGSVIGGGPGTGVGNIVGLIPSALQALIRPFLAGKLVVGSYSGKMASAIAFGITTHVMTAGKIIYTDVGAVAPPPVGPVPIPAAPGYGRIL